MDFSRAKEWSKEEVSTWLKDIGFEEHVDLFYENDIDGEQLLELNQDHLKELGVPSLGKRMKLLKHVSYLPNAKPLESGTLPRNSPTERPPMERPPTERPQIERPPRPTKSLLVVKEKIQRKHSIQSEIGKMRNENETSQSEVNSKEHETPKTPKEVEEKEKEISIENNLEGKGEEHQKQEEEKEEIEKNQEEKIQSQEQEQKEEEKNEVIQEQIQENENLKQNGNYSQEDQVEERQKENEEKEEIERIEEQKDQKEEKEEKKEEINEEVKEKEKELLDGGLIPEMIHESESNRKLQFASKTKTLLLSNLPPPPKFKASETDVTSSHEEKNKSETDYEDSDSDDQDIEAIEINQDNLDNKEQASKNNTNIEFHIDPISPSSRGLMTEDNRPVIASAVRTDKFTIDGNTIEVKKGELFIVVEMGDNWTVKPVERRGNNIVLPADLFFIDNHVFYKMQEQYGKKVFISEEPKSTKSVNSKMINIATKDLVDPEMVGYLLKIGGSYVSKKVWRKRWFILKDFVLYYFKTPGDSAALGKIPLPGYVVSSADDFGVNSKKFSFKISHPNSRTYVFAASSNEYMQQWIQAITSSTVLQPPQSPQTPSPQNTS